MSKTTITEQALSYIAGEVAASGRRPATEVAARILERLEKGGINVIRHAQTDTLQAPISVRIDQADSEPLAPKFDATVVRDAYRLGFERGTYESGGDPCALDLAGSSYLWGQASDLAVHLGDNDVQACFDAFIGTQSSEPVETYEITPEGEAIIRDMIETTPLTQEAVTTAGYALEADFDAAPARFVRHVTGRDHDVGANALAVRDVIEAHRLLGLAVATLGHEAVDAMMRALPAPVLGAAAA